jgi:serine/threonine-protein kinase
LIGATLSHYLLTAKLGEGGMGEVYRATDRKLDREVAIKVLPAAFTKDAERLGRFEREAKLLAQLHHPNIAAIFGLEESGGVRALVLELVEGEDLAQRLARGAIPVDEAIAIARQIADALEAAHEKGIVHRDLKPQNVKLGADGRVKVLDFGLAKAMDPASSRSGSPAASPTLMSSPTLTAAGTQLGMILGTAAYMAPEQARGGAVDKRADIWAFGVVLFEMLTGRRLFDGETVSDVLAAVLTRDPGWSALPAATPPAVVRLLRRCLERDPKKRLHDIADARLELDAAADSAADVAPLQPAPARRGAAFWAGCGIVAVALVLAGAFADRRLAPRQEAAAQQVMRFQLLPRKDERLAFDFNGRTFAISPDGSKLVYAVEKPPTSELRLRSLGAEESTAMPGTEGGTSPFFSPDGKWIGFIAGPKLKKVALAGGTPVTLADVPSFRGAVWGDDGAIYFVPNSYVPISRIPAGGGKAEPVTKIRAQEGELQHRFPELLPGGKVLLYAIGYGGEWDEATIVAERLDTGERKVLVKGGTSPRYLPSGHLAYARSGSLYAVAFDAPSLTTAGPPAEVARDILIGPTGLAQMDVSQNGMLVTAPADSVAGASMLSWIDREGRREPLRVPRQPYNLLFLSPDGNRAALGVGNGLSVLDLARLSLTRLTLPARAELPVWSRDGRRVYFGYEKDKYYQVFSKAADDSGLPELLFPTQSTTDPQSISPDGSRLLFVRASPAGLKSLMIKDLSHPRDNPRTLYESLFVVDNVPATFSPDGRWVVYASQESGRPEIYVRPASGEDRKWQVSIEGGTLPIWSRVGNEIFFVCGQKLLAAPVDAKGDELSSGAPRVLFDNHEVIAYDAARDGKRFLVAEDPNPGAQTKLDVVVHWLAEVRRKVEEARTP